MTFPKASVADTSSMPYPLEHPKLGIPPICWTMSWLPPQTQNYLPKMGCPRKSGFLCSPMPPPTTPPAHRTCTPPLPPTQQPPCPSPFSSRLASARCRAPPADGCQRTARSPRSPWPPRSSRGSPRKNRTGSFPAGLCPGASGVWLVTTGIFRQMSRAGVSPDLSKAFLLTWLQLRSILLSGKNGDVLSVLRAFRVNTRGN